MPNWKKYKLGELMDVQNGYAFKSDDLKTTGTPIIKIRNIQPPNISFAEADYYADKINGRLNQFVVKKKDILISMTGSHVSQFASAVGKVGRYGFDKPALLNQRVGKLYSKDKSQLNEDFLYYLIARTEVQFELATNAGGSANQANISTQHIKDLEFDIPDIESQTRIASILSALDDKIELNRLTNHTLEQIVQTLFKKYFVTDIDPGNLPDNLEGKNLGDIAEVIDCLHSKKPDISENHTGNIFLQLENLLDNGLLDMSKVFVISNEDYKKWIRRIEVQFGDCVITNVGRSGVAARIPKGVKAAMGRNMTAIRLKKEFNYPAFLITLLTSDYMKREIESNLDVGTILNALNVRSIPKLKLLFPKTLTLIVEVENKLAPLIMLMEENLKEIFTLSKIRDSLLPKLMSGEIEVS